MPRKLSPDAPSPESAGRATTGGASAGAKVLIVEDNPDLLEILRDLLSQEFDVATARDGQEGVDTARSFQPDVVIMDLHLPRMSGIDAGLSIKREVSADVPILALTANAAAGISEQVLRSGCCDAYMPKPASLDAIRGKVRELLGQGAAGPDEGAPSTR
ncbi:MAG TPA: response regulator [Longimicrobiales bacterium]|nr:response regulator [Longimicrobiales bacterium]